MNKKSKILQSSLLAALMIPLAGIAYAQDTAPWAADIGVITPTGPVTPPNHVRDANGNPPAGNGTPLYRVCMPATAACPAGASYVLHSTDGSQLTWGRWSAITGTVRSKCTVGGTHFTVHVSRAVPKALYTVWLVLPDLPPGMPAGNPEGTNNAFMTSATGEGQLSFFRPGIAGDPRWPACVLSSPYAAHAILAYHMDGQSHGASPGDPSTQAFQAVAIIK